MISRIETVLTTLFGTSMPTAGLFGIGLQLRTPEAAARLSAMSSARLVILLISHTSRRLKLVPCKTAGPRAMSIILVCTPKLCRVETSFSCVGTEVLPEVSSPLGLSTSFKMEIEV